MAGGKRGRPKKPTALKVLEGNPGRRPLPEDEPEFEKGIPNPPAHLADDELAIWNEHAPMLHKAGLLTVADGPRLAEYCEALAMGNRLKLQAIANPVYESDSGYTQPTAYVSEFRKWRIEARRLGALFGLDPSSRASLNVKPPSDDMDELERLVSM